MKSNALPGHSWIERISFLDRAKVIYGVCATAILELVNPAALPELAPYMSALKDCVAKVRQQLEESAKNVRAQR
jgi:hypothetical protein